MKNNKIGYYIKVTLFLILLLILSQKSIYNFKQRAFKDKVNTLTTSLNLFFQNIETKPNKNAQNILKELGIVIYTNNDIKIGLPSTYLDNKSYSSLITKINKKKQKFILDGKYLYFYFYNPAYLNDQHPYIIKWNAEQFLQMTKILNIDISIILLVCYFLFIFFYRLKTDYLTYSIQRIENFCKNIAQKNYSSKLFLESDNPLYNTANYLNTASEHLMYLKKEVKAKKEELDQIFFSIHDAVLILNEVGKIKYFNKSFSELVNNQCTLNERYWNSFQKHPKLLEFIKNHFEDEDESIHKLQLNNKTYLCSSNFFTETGTIIFFFYDISEVESLQQIKRDFVANVSHELKTPLTAIMGFVETLQEMETDKTKLRYLDIVARHSLRLNNIIKDLLLLSEMEKTGFHIRNENIDLNNLLKNLLTMFYDPAEKKGLYIKFQPGDMYEMINGDYFKLEQVFINLIDNAIKYTNEGGIIISTTKENNEFVIKIKDSGIGIPPEDIPRLFERFYTVDKSHSRKLGGTGLGLSIVKHIVNLHKGSIHIQSEVNRGTKFTLKFPII